jgi:nucleoside-diphosphate-sugar epimerase
MQILILGSKGQIGQALTSYLRMQGEEVLEFDLLISKTHDLRISRNQELVKILSTQQVDFVVFLAFDVGGAKYLKSSQKNKDFISNNLRIMESTFTILSEFSTPFVFASTQMSQVQNSTYGTLKSIGEKYTRALGGLNMKLWNVYGNETDVDRFHVISDFIRMALENRKIAMLTDGQERRDLLHADDCAKSIFKVILNFQSLVGEGEVHIASFTWTKILDIANIVSRFTGAEVIAGEQQDTTYLQTEIAPDLKYKDFSEPDISLETGIQRLIFSAN